MKYYVAYGSNLNREQMAHRCPDAKLVEQACCQIMKWCLEEIKAMQLRL